MNTEPNILYIYGPAASGKGILQKLLDGHPQLATHPNHDKLPIGLHQFLDNYDPSKNISFTKLRRALCKTSYYLYEDSSYSKNFSTVTTANEYKRGDLRANIKFYEAEKEWTNQMYNAEPKSIEGMASIILKSIFQHWEEYPYDENECRYYIGMGGSNSAAMNKLIDGGEEFKVIFIYRDPRAVIGSYGARPGKSIEDLIKRGKVFEIQKLIESAKYLEQKYNKRFFVIRFTDLILNTNQIMKEVANFLNIEQKEVLNAPTFCGKKIGPKNNYVGEIKDNWKELASEDEQYALNLQVGKVPRNLNFSGGLLYLKSILTKVIKSVYDQAGERGKRLLYT